jgi:hypothetical protein
MMKTCNGCQQEFHKDDFPKNSGKCKSCKAAYSTEYRRKNKDRINAKAREWLKSKPGYAKQRLEKSPVLAAKRKALEAERWKRMKDQNPNIGKERYEKNREKILHYMRRYNKENRVVLRQRLKKFRDANPDSVAFENQRRRAKERSISWDRELDAFVLSEAHSLRSLRKKSTGINWHLDHIEPLHGKDVSGLHNAFNFAVVPASFNCAKGNRRIEGNWVRYT